MPITLRRDETLEDHAAAEESFSLGGVLRSIPRALSTVSKELWGTKVRKATVVIGAGAGAVIGSKFDSPYLGALIGAAVAPISWYGWRCFPEALDTFAYVKGLEENSPKF